MSYIYIYIYIYIYMERTFLIFLDHTRRRSTVGRTPLDEWSARRRDLYLTTHDTHNRQTWMPPVGFEPTISAGERPQTYALDGAATFFCYSIYLPIVDSIHLWHCTSETISGLSKFNKNCFTRPGFSTMFKNKRSLYRRWSPVWPLY